MLNIYIKYSLISIPLVLLLLIFFTALPVSATGATPPDNYVSVPQGGTFLLRGSITFDDPSENGYFNYVFYWYHYDNADENFTLENVSVYWTSDNTSVENVSVDDYEITDGHQVQILDNDSAGGVGSIVRDGTFTIDVWLRAASGDGTPHRPDNQWIYFSAGGKIILYEPDPQFVDAPPIYVEVTPVGVTVDITPDNQTAWYGENLAYTVTVCNTGATPDNYTLILADDLGWSMYIQPGTLEIDNGQCKNATLIVTVGTGTDNIMVTADGVYADNSDNCKAIQRTGLNVDVEILPPKYQSGAPGENLWYTAVITNTGTVPDNFNLALDDALGWVLFVKPDWAADNLLVTIDDTHVMENLPDNVACCPYGEKYNMYVGHDEPTYGHERPYLKFDLSPIPADAEILDATLHTYNKYSPSSGESPYTPCDLGVEAVEVADDSWLENELTWNNAPSIGSMIDNIMIKSTHTNHWNVWDVTSYIAQELDGDGVASIALRGRAEDDNSDCVVWMYTKDVFDYQYSYRPHLEITYASADDNHIQVSLENGENVTLLFGVTVPYDEENCTEDNIIITVTSEDNVNVSDNDSCTAHLLARVELRDDSGGFYKSYWDIQPAIDNALSNYTVLVHPGTYWENLYVNKGSLTIRSTGGAENTIIDAGGAESGVKIEAAGVTFGGFTVKNEKYGIWLNYSHVSTVENNICENSLWGIYLSNSDHNTVINNTCENSRAYGILVSSSENNLIENNLIENNIDYGIYVVESFPVTIRSNVIENNDYGIVFSGVILNTTVTIDNNLIQGCSDWGIDLYNWVDNIENSQVIIENNRIINNPDTYAIDLDTPIYLSEIVIMGNTIDNNGDEGIYWDIIQDSDVLIQNNTISNNGYEGIYFGGDIYGNSEVMIYNNSISNNDYSGIDFYEIYGNSEVMIYGNTIENNGSYAGVDFDDYIYDNSMVMIMGNTIEDSEEEGIDFEEIYGNSMVWVYGNTIGNNGEVGIDFDDYIYGNAMVGIVGNTIENNDYEGIRFYEIYDNSMVMVTNNSISNNNRYGHGGIYFVAFSAGTYGNSMVMIMGNTIDNNGHGIYIEGDILAPVVIFLNDITNNEMIDSGVHVESGVDTTGLMVNFNNIVGNSPSENNYGVYNIGDNKLNALYNWWGHTSGPGGEGPGTGDNVSENVYYRPWIPEPLEDAFVGIGGGMVSKGHNENIKPALENLDQALIPENEVPIPENVVISMDSKGNGMIMITLFDNIGGAPIPGDLVAGMFADITTIPENIAENIWITVEYTDEDVVGIEEGSLELYYWSSTDEAWHLCQNIAVDTAANTITGYVDHLSPFGMFGPISAALPGVNVSISPSYRGGTPGTELTYTVTVTNTGGATDTYDLQISGGTGWAPKLDDSSLSIGAGGSKTTTLRVTVPSGASEGDSTTVTVTATSLLDPAVSDSDTCTARATASHPPPPPLEEVPGVSVWISPSNQDGAPGGTITFTVTVKNTGTITDSYTLGKSDTAGWSLSLASSVGPLDPDESTNVTLEVTIPSDAEAGDSTTVTVTATSQEDADVSDFDTCTATAKVEEEGLPWIYIFIAVAIIFILIILGLAARRR